CLSRLRGGGPDEARAGDPGARRPGNLQLRDRRRAGDQRADRPHAREQRPGQAGALLKDAGRPARRARGASIDSSGYVQVCLSFTSFVVLVRVGCPMTGAPHPTRLLVMDTSVRPDYVLDLAAVRDGGALNRLCGSLTDAAGRARFTADEAGCCE